MNSLSKAISIFLIGFSILPFFSACSDKDRVPENEEESLYLLVGEPCADGEYATAIRRADSILSAPRQLSDTLKAYIMIDRDVSILEAGHSDWAAAYADTVIEFGRCKNITLAVMQGLQNRGIISRRNGDYGKAIDDYKEGLELAVKEEDLEMQQVFSGMLAIACAEYGRYDEATSFAKRSLEMSRESGDDVGELNSISTIGGILVKAGRYEEAIRELMPYHDRSLKAKNVLRVKYLTPLLRSYLSLDSLQRVRQTLDETYEALSDVPRGTQAYLVAVNTEAGLAGKEGRYADQWHWYQVADAIGSMGTSPDVWYAQRAECLAHLGRYQEAYELQRRAFLQLDSLRIGENDRRLLELSVRYDTLSKENSIVKLKSQRLLWALVALVCLIVVVVVVLFAVASRRKARRRLEHERQEQYLSGLEQERARMARELHDDIAGSLVALQWQLRGHEPEEVEKNLIAIAKKVRTLSHELMPPEFKEGEFAGMLMDYVDRFNKAASGRRIILTDEGTYQWETLAPEVSHGLYRIVQEAVSNAVSHGAPGDVHIILSGDDKFELSVSNPFENEKKESDEDSGIGFRSLRARAEMIGACVDFICDDGFFNLKVVQKN